jgi:hypothetical protein
MILMPLHFDAPPSVVEKDVASPVQVIEAKVFQRLRLMNGRRLCQ